MAFINYEFPLNEKVRTYLRIEYLLKRLALNAQDFSESSSLAYLETLFSISDVIERGDLRGDLVKDLEKHEKNLVTWSELPDIDSQVINDLLEQVVTASNNLSKSPRLGTEIKEDRFLSSIRQRFSIPGGTCCFDLPHLHQWLNKPIEEREKDVLRWDEFIRVLRDVVTLDLKFLREKGHSKMQVATNGFFQDATENTELLQIIVDNQLNVYPTVSGNKHRFSIRFMENCSVQGKSATEQNINFRLTCC